MGTCHLHGVGRGTRNSEVAAEARRDCFRKTKGRREPKFAPAMAWPAEVSSRCANAGAEHKKHAYIDRATPRNCAVGVTSKSAAWRNQPALVAKRRSRKLCSRLCAVFVSMMARGASGPMTEDKSRRHEWGSRARQRRGNEGADNTTKSVNQPLSAPHVPGMDFQKPQSCRRFSGHKPRRLPHSATDASAQLCQAGVQAAPPQKTRQAARTRSRAFRPARQMARAPGG